MTEQRMIGHALDIEPPSSERAEQLRRAKDRGKQVDAAGWRDGPLHVITGERQTGKSELALRWLQDAPAGTHRVLVTATARMADELRARAGLTRRDERILSADQLRARRATGMLVPDAEYGIDEAGEVLARLLGLRSTPHLVTVTLAEAWQGEQS